MLSKQFFDSVRANVFHGGLSQLQVDALTAIDAAWEKYGNGDPQAEAYVQATILNEVGPNLQPVPENLNYSAERAYAVWPNKFPTLASAQPYAHNPEKLGNFVYANRYGNGDAASGDGFKYRGHGYQTTWKANFKTIGDVLGVDLVTDPTVLDHDVKLAAEALIVGMVRGLYTGKKLSDYFGSNKALPIPARAIVNGDVSSTGPKVAANWKLFLGAFKAAPAPVPHSVPTTTHAPGAPVPSSVLVPAIEPNLLEKIGMNLSILTLLIHYLPLLPFLQGDFTQEVKIINSSQDGQAKLRQTLEVLRDAIDQIEATMDGKNPQAVDITK
jgi:putative chitinase